MLAKNESGIRACETCEQHANVREEMIKATTNLEHICGKINKQCESIDSIWKEVDKRLKIRPFYVLISVLITVLIFMLAMQLGTYSSIGDLQRNLEIVKYEIKADLAGHEGETSQLMKRMDEVTKRQTTLMEKVIDHMTVYPINKIKKKPNEDEKED